MRSLVSLLNVKGRVWNPPEDMVLSGPASICGVTGPQSASGTTVEILEKAIACSHYTPFLSALGANKQIHGLVRLRCMRENGFFAFSHLGKHANC